MSDTSEDYVLKSFTQAVQGLVTSVKEMLEASKLLRGRIESNDHVLNRVENKCARLEERLANVERDITQLSNGINARFKHQWDRYHDHVHAYDAGTKTTSEPVHPEITNRNS